MVNLEISWWRWETHNGVCSNFLCLYVISVNIQFSSNLKGQKSLQFLVIGRLQNRCGDTLFLYTGTSSCIRIFLEPDQISQTQSMVAKRGLTNHTIYTPANLAAIGHRFTAKKKRKLKMLKRWSEATRNQRLFWGLMCQIFDSIFLLNDVTCFLSSFTPFFPPSLNIAFVMLISFSLCCGSLSFFK